MGDKKGSASLMSKEKPTVKQCKHCKSEIPYDAKVCPVCRKKQGAPGSLIVVLVVAMRLISVFFDIQLPGALARHNTYLPSEAKYLKRPVIHPDRDDDDTDRDGRQ